MRHHRVYNECLRMNYFEEDLPVRHLSHWNKYITEQVWLDDCITNVFWSNPSQCFECILWPAATYTMESPTGLNKFNSARFGPHANFRSDFEDDSFMAHHSLTKSARKMTLILIIFSVQLRPYSKSYQIVCESIHRLKHCELC